MIDLPRELVVEMASGVQGWMSRAELSWLYRFADLQNPGCVWVEVGVWKGRSFLATALGLPNRSELIGVDSFRGNPGSDVHDEVEVPGWLEANVEFVLETADRFNPEAHTELRKATSLAASREVEDESVDVVFLDADHAREAVERDIRAWWPKLRSGGFMCGHDLHANHPGVEIALERTLGQMIPCAGTIWMVPKDLGQLKPHVPYEEDTDDEEEGEQEE